MAETEIYTDEGFAERVRAIVSADVSEFSDSLLNSFDYKGMAEIAVKKAVPAWQDILNSGDTHKIELLKTCVVLETGVIIMPSVLKGSRKVEQTTNSKVEYFENSGLTDLLNQLYERLQMLYAELLDEDINESYGFTLVDITNPHKRYCGGGFV